MTSQFFAFAVTSYAQRISENVTPPTMNTIARGTIFANVFSLCQLPYRALLLFEKQIKIHYAECHTEFINFSNLFLTLLTLSVHMNQILVNDHAKMENFFHLKLLQRNLP